MPPRWICQTKLQIALSYLQRSKTYRQIGADDAAWAAGPRLSGHAVGANASLCRRGRSRRWPAPSSSW
jgi:hypothetical protein